MPITQTKMELSQQVMHHIAQGGHGLSSPNVLQGIKRIVNSVRRDGVPAPLVLCFVWIRLFPQHCCAATSICFIVSYIWCDG